MRNQKTTTYTVTYIDGVPFYSFNRSNHKPK